jgi:hypothetical protein
VKRSGNYSILVEAASILNSCLYIEVKLKEPTVHFMLGLLHGADNVKRLVGTSRHHQNGMRLDDDLLVRPLVFQLCVLGNKASSRDANSKSKEVSSYHEARRQTGSDSKKSEDGKAQI